MVERALEAPPGDTWSPARRPEDLPEQVQELAQELNDRLHKDSFAECGWHFMNSRPDRVECVHLGMPSAQGVYVRARYFTRGPFLAGLRHALESPVVEGPHVHVVAAAPADGAQHAQPARRQALPLWALALALAALATGLALATGSAPGAPLASLAAYAQHKVLPMAGDARNVTGAWPPALRELEAQPSLEDATALLGLADTKALSDTVRLLHARPGDSHSAGFKRAHTDPPPAPPSQADAVLRNAWTAKSALNETCAARNAAIRRDLASRLEAITAGVQAGQPLAPEPAAAAMARGNRDLEDLAASCAASAAGLDEELKRITRVVRALAVQRGVLEHGQAAAAAARQHAHTEA